jgi:hypothetical protein
MGFSPLQNELQNNYAVVTRPQPLLAGVRRYSGDCGGNATERGRAEFKPVKPHEKPGPEAGFCFAMNKAGMGGSA